MRRLLCSSVALLRALGRSHHPRRYFPKEELTVGVRVGKLERVRVPLANQGLAATAIVVRRAGQSRPRAASTASTALWTPVQRCSTVMRLLGDGGLRL